MKKVWYKWPQGYIRGLLPLYLILWRLPFAILIAVLVVLICLLYVLAGTKDLAQETWRDYIG